MARIDEWGLTGGLAALGAFSYAGGKTLAPDFTKEALRGNTKFRAINMKKPMLGKVLKHYPNALKGMGLAGMAVGAAGLAWCIFDEIREAKEGKLA